MMLVARQPEQGIVPAAVKEVASWQGELRDGEATLSGWHRAFRWSLGGARAIAIGTTGAPGLLDDGWRCLYSVRGVVVARLCIRIADRGQPVCAAVDQGGAVQRWVEAVHALESGSAGHGSASGSFEPALLTAPGAKAAALLLLPELKGEPALAYPLAMAARRCQERLLRLEEFLEQCSHVAAGARRNAAVPPGA